MKRYLSFHSVFVCPLLAGQAEAVSKAPLITDSHRHVRTKRGATVELPCIAQAVPPPSYQWFRRLKRQSVPVPVVPSGRVSQYDGTLYIHQASTNDAGTYLCQTNNSMGMETTETELIVTGLYLN